MVWMLQQVRCKLRHVLADLTQDDWVASAGAEHGADLWEAIGELLVNVGYQLRLYPFTVVEGKCAPKSLGLLRETDERADTSEQHQRWLASEALAKLPAEL